MWWKGCKNQSSISRDIRQNTPVFWPRHTRRSQMSPVNSGVTGPNFTKFPHDIQASYTLLTRIARPWYCNSFSSSSEPNAGGIWYQSTLIHFRNIIWLPSQRPLINWKKATDPSSVRNAVSYGVKIAKIGPVDPEI